ncbi:hypothetical protein VZT92_021954 [Zoarces viviparus]|uniref:Uncharacterized protein n=1 Tax=Zoarces viviparus TaxID=48416 RepID=A0AAW1EAH2_ZOAVI
MDCGLFVLNCNMRAIKRGSQSHSVASSLAVATGSITAMPSSCAAAVNLPHVYNRGGSGRTTAERLAAQERK